MTMFHPNLSSTKATANAESSGKKQLSADARALKEYVMGSDGRAKGESTVLLHVSHSNLKKTFFQV